MAKLIDNSQLERELKKALKDVAKSVRSRLLTPTNTWEEQPYFDITEDNSGDDMVVRVMTEHDHYFWLDDGTSVRYATMTKPFKAKTTPGSFAATPGEGGLAYVSRKQARPGITARGWTKMASLEYSPVLQVAIDKVLAQFAGGNKLFSYTRRIHGMIDE